MCVYHTYVVDFLQVHELLCLGACGLTPAAALTAVVAVLRATASLDAQQRATLDLQGLNVRADPQQGKRSRTAVPDSSDRQPA